MADGMITGSKRNQPQLAFQTYRRPIRGLGTTDSTRLPGLHDLRRLGTARMPLTPPIPLPTLMRPDTLPLLQQTDRTRIDSQSHIIRERL